MAEQLKGKAVANAMKEDLSKRVEALKAKGVTPKLVLFGSVPVLMISFMKAVKRCRRHRFSFMKYLNIRKI